MATELFMECILAEKVLTASAQPVWKTYVMHTANDLHLTNILQTETKWYGEVTKRGSEYGFFHGWECATSDVQISCHRFLPSEDWENIIDVRYTKDDTVQLYVYEESNTFATLL